MITFGTKTVNREAIIGCILGTAVGDALGLPYEGVSPRRAQRMPGPPDRYRFCFRRGMISDDTEHTCMVAQSLIEAGGDVEVFTNRLASRLRWWIVALPAGVGKATARSCLRLWLGFNPRSAGVHSAGNGPAMRAAIFGAAIDDLPLMLKLVRASSRLTHTDPKAEQGAIVVALAAKQSRDHQSFDANVWLMQVTEVLGNDAAECIDLLRQVITSIQAKQSTRTFAESLGLAKGVTGYTFHTVPLAIHAWLSFPNNYQRAVTEIIGCGGDADTTAAIVGGIVGAGVGRQGIPDPWINGIWEWPRSVQWMQSLGDALAQSMSTNQPARAPTIHPLAVLIRNLFFLAVVLFHGFRRLAPPF